MHNLTQHQKQQIIQHIQNNQPLPTHLRQLLQPQKNHIELIWKDKTTQTTNTTLPFQTIEHIDEPRPENPSANPQAAQTHIFTTDTRGRQLTGWTNKLIWGDNKLILSSLNNGPLRQQIENQGGLKLIYIDPPFDVGADFSMNIDIGNDTLTKKPNTLEEIAYRDTWGDGANSFIAMIYERLILMHKLLADNGSIYVHCDWRVNAYIRLALDEIFGKENFRNEIIWSYPRARPGGKQFARLHDLIFWYSKGDEWKFNNDEMQVPLSAEALKVNKIVRPDGSIWKRTRNTKDMPDVWEIIFQTGSKERRINYPTQKPKALIERIIKASSNENDLIADFFCGSGTLPAVAEKLNRKWIAADLSKFAIHTTRKRLIAIQRQHKTDNKNYRAFELLNLGKYQRQHYIGITPGTLTPQQIQTKTHNYQKLILQAYTAQPIKHSNTFHGQKANAHILIGPIDQPVNRKHIHAAVQEALRLKSTSVDILGFEFEMGIFPNALDEAKQKGVTINPKYIPNEVFDQRAIQQNQITFHNVPHIQAKTQQLQNGKITVTLTNFSVHCSQDTLTQAEKELRNRKNGTRIIVENGHVIKIKKENGKLNRETLTKHWTDWIDYWSVDFDFQNKKETIQTIDPKTNQIKTQETGDYIFENEWQTFRTKNDRSLELTTAPYQLKPGAHKIAVKVVDIFGCDTIKTIDKNITAT